MPSAPIVVGATSKLDSPALTRERKSTSTRAPSSPASPLATASTATVPAAVEATAGNQQLPALATLAPGSVYLAWQDERSGQERVRVARSRDGGDSFEPSVLIDDPGTAEGDQRGPALTVGADGVVYAAWVDFTKPDSGIFFARSVE